METFRIRMLYVSSSSGMYLTNHHSKIPRWQRACLSTEFFACLAPRTISKRAGRKNDARDTAQRCPLLGRPLVDVQFALNALEFVGLIGGIEVISVMAMIPLYRGRRWLGWYNTPGSLDIARHLGDFASSFRTRPYKTLSPTALLGLDCQMGPTFLAAFSGTETQTGHLGYLTVERSKEMGEKVPEEVIRGRETAPTSVILLDFQTIDLDRPFPLLHISHTLLALIPITTSVVTCLLCGFVSDWYMFSVILAGIFTSGFTSMVIGSGRLTLQSLRGDALTVSAITEGRFKLGGSGYWQATIRVCSLFYLAECVAQLVLVPQGTLFGQIMFIVSLCVSWGYSYRLTSFKKERLQAELLFSKLGVPKIRKLRVGTRTTTSVFVCLLLFHGVRHLSCAAEYDRVLTALLPASTSVWRCWREKVVSQLQEGDDESLSHLEVAQDQELSTADRRLLHVLLEDARAAFLGYLDIYRSLPMNSSTTLKEY
ncbi:hypothetical protein J3R83DRAFT_7310 [Lanmaoa asiatica]|nr:hypothetical protein J3R83DRAFT_7310 [Lanmaoa asiatica]